MNVMLVVNRIQAAIPMGLAAFFLAASSACFVDSTVAAEPTEQSSEPVENGGNEQTPPNAADSFVSAIDLLPESTAGVVRIPELPAFCEAWKKTQLGVLMGSDEMKPFLDAQRDRATNYFETLDRKIGVKPRDLYDMTSGEVVVAWLSFEGDKRRPYSLCVAADIRGMKAQADAAAAKIDADLIAGGAVRRDVTYGEETIRVYRTKPKPGQLKIEEIALTWNDNRFIAADRDVVVQQLLDVIAGKTERQGFSRRASFQTVRQDAHAAIEKSNEPSATVCWEWFAEPFAMGRIVREIIEYDRGNSLDILALLERQGFDVIEAVGGVGVVAGDRFDVLHRGVVLAPGKLTKGAKILQPLMVPRAPIPRWVSQDSGAFYRFNWDLEDSFWAAESLVNDALDDDLFRPMIDGIKNDPEGPQIDLAKDFLPNLDNELILITDNTLPAGPESDRMLIALRIKNSDVVRRVVQKAMEVEPDAIKLDVAEFDVWKVERGEGDADIDQQLAELGFDEELEMEDSAPLLNHWAIAVVPGSDGPDYLMFSSHSELLVKLGKRVALNAEEGMATTPITNKIAEQMDQLQANEVTMEGILHPSISLRARWALLRKGELKDSDSLIANVLRRLVEKNEDGEPDPIHAAKLPPFEKIKPYLNSGGTFWQRTDSGWRMTGFLLKE
jgi:hypothetical protein